MNPAALIFLLTYVLVSLGENSPRKLDRPTATLLGAVLMVISGSLSRTEAHKALDFGTLAILFGLMILLTVLMQSGLPTWLAFKVLNRCRNPRELLAIVVFTSGLGSALMLNDTICLLGTPLTAPGDCSGRTEADPIFAGSGHQRQHRQRHDPYR